MALTQITSGMLQGIGKVRIPAYAALIGTLIKIPINAFLIAIPEINVIGAVISTIFCYLIASCIDVYFLVKYTDVKLDFGVIIFKPAIAAVIMGVSSYTFYFFSYFFTASNSFSLIIAVLLGALIYFVILILLRGVYKEDVLHLPKGKTIVRFLEKINAF